MLCCEFWQKVKQKLNKATCMITRVTQNYRYWDSYHGTTKFDSLFHKPSSVHISYLTLGWPTSIERRKLTCMPQLPTKDRGVELAWQRGCYAMKQTRVLFMIAFLIIDFQIRRIFWEAAALIMCTKYKNAIKSMRNQINKKEYDLEDLATKSCNRNYMSGPDYMSSLFPFTVLTRIDA